MHFSTVQRVLHQPLTCHLAQTKIQKIVTALLKRSKNSIPQNQLKANKEVLQCLQKQNRLKTSWLSKQGIPKPEATMVPGNLSVLIITFFLPKTVEIANTAI